MNKLRKPLEGNYPVTQTFEQHVQRAKELGLCHQPGMANCRGYYYGGIDYGCPAGTPVYAAHDGVVETRMEKTGYGYHVRISRPEMMTIYAHLRSFTVQNKQQVRAGDLIGYSGGVPGEPGAGNTSGPHLHFELRLNGYPTDPSKYMEQYGEINEPTGQMPALEYVRLKRGEDYVNIRTGPGLQYAIAGRLLPDDEPKRVVGVNGEWVCLLKWCGIQLWSHINYLESADAR